MRTKTNMRAQGRRRRPTTTSLLVLQVAVLLLASQQVQCISSYIDEYFLPTAKLALNRIQQSLASAKGAGERQVPANGSDEAPASLLITSGPITTTTTSSITEATSTTTGDSSPGTRQANESEQMRTKEVGEQPNGSDFVSLETRPDGSSESEPGAERERTEPAEVVSVVSSTEASSTSRSAASDSSPPAPAEEAAVAGEEAPASQNQPDLASNSIGWGSGPETSKAKGAAADEAAIAETELEAVAAVDASIGFGGDLFGSAADPCYDEYGNARFCEPPFENLAYERQVEVSSECGQPPSRFCTSHLNERGDQVRNCHICDAQHPKKRHPAAYLTDMNNSNNPTCWISAPISAGPASNQSAAGAEQPLARDNVTLSLSLAKRYEITYISMQFCSLKPDSLAIYRSQDHGQSWSPYQFYSSQCGRMYGMASSAPGARHGPTGPIEAICVNGSSPTTSSPGANAARIAFSTLDGLRSAPSQPAGGPQQQVEAELQDWLTATNIRIVLDQHQASWIQSTLGHAHHHHRQAPAGNQTAATGPAAQRPPSSSLQPAGELPESSLTSPSATFNYALSDLTVGGRCKCNGHASRCIHSREGQLQCDCRHNTSGRDCERCAPFHFDRPWQPASQLDASPCQPCQCNGHSRRCKFDPALYKSSGGRSGGVCIHCRDNTAGRHCNYCREGFTRDHSKPMADKEACKPCDCHPVGSLGRVCNITTGQCPCKEGVAGLECNRCAPGYQQSSSPSEPCIKLPENDINYGPTIEANSEPGPAASGPSSGAEDEPSILAGAGQGQDSGQEQARAPSGGRQSNSSRRPAEEADEASGEPATDDEGSNEALAVRSRQRPQHHWPRTNKHHTNYGQRLPSRSRYEFDDNLDGYGAHEELEPDLMRQRPPPVSPGAPYSGLGQPKYLANGNYYAKRNQFADFRHGQRTREMQQVRGRHQPNELLIPPSASLEPDSEEEAQANGQLANFMPIDQIYSTDDNNNFNQIHASPNQVHSVPGRQRSGQLPAAFMKGRPTGGGRRQAGDRAESQQPNSFTCADCQSNTRRLTFRQFCHLDYAIKALVLNKFMAEDWTRFDVEIQDVFKSPGSSSMLAAASGRPNLSQVNSNYLDNIIQSDDPNVLASNRSLGENALAIASGDQQHATGGPLHRLKVASVQSIWAPTEDVSCKCPRLKLRSSYLLMGFVDSKSATSIQLDRHGVALEWRSSNLQARLVRYQRRQSKGRC